MHCPWKGTKKEAIESFLTFADALRDEIDMLCKPLSISCNSDNNAGVFDKHAEHAEHADGCKQVDEHEYRQIFETLGQKVFGIDSLYDEQLKVMNAVLNQQDTVRIRFIQSSSLRSYQSYSYFSSSSTNNLI